MNRLTISQQDHSKDPITGLGNSNPTSNPTIGLGVLARGLPKRPLDPFVSDHGPIGVIARKYAVVFTDPP